MLFDKGVRTKQGQSFQQMLLKGYSHAKEVIRPLTIQPCTKINLKMDLNVRTKTIKTLKRKHRGFFLLHDTGFGNSFLDITTAQITKK